MDLGAEDAVSDFVTVPQGTYVCEIAEVRVGTTRAGDPRWSMRLVVTEGEYVGRQAAWDNLVFSARGRARARLVLGALGLPNRGKVALEPADLEGRRVLVEVRPAAYESAEGTTVRRNEVPYEGYRLLQDENGGAAGDGGGTSDDIPF